MDESTEISPDLKGSRLDLEVSRLDLNEILPDLNKISSGLDRSEDERDISLVGLIFAGFQNPKPPLNPHPSGSNVGDPSLVVGCPDWVNLGLGDAGSVDSSGLSVALDSPTWYFRSPYF